MNDLPSIQPEQPTRNLPDVDAAEAFEAVVASPNTASKEWVYRQYDHEVGAKTATGPGDDAAILAIRDAETGLALSSGTNPSWTDTAPYDGAYATALENATNLAAKGARPLAAVDCLNGGNPEKPDVYGEFSAMVDGLADGCSALDVPVVGGNVSLYNDSTAGPIPPTPTLAMIGTKEGYDAPPLTVEGGGTLLLVGGFDDRLGGSEYLATAGGTDRFPELPPDPGRLVEAIATVANLGSTTAAHDVSDGGLAVTLAEMVGKSAGIQAEVPSKAALFSEAPGRVVVETDDPDDVRQVLEDVAEVDTLGTTDDVGRLAIDLTEPGTELSYSAEALAALRETIADALD
jgi:phosphoribosylformylglycinamidine synthase